MALVNERGNPYMLETIDKTSTAVIKAAPAVGGTAWSLSSLPWHEIAAIFTVFYTSLLIADWFWKKYQAFKSWKKAQAE